MHRIKVIFPFFSSVLTFLPLIFAPLSLMVYVKQLVLMTWFGISLGKIFNTKGTLLSLILLSSFAIWIGFSPITDYQKYWLYACAASLACSMLVYLLNEKKINLPTLPEPSEASENSELDDLKKQLKQLVQYQYRCLETEQALEHEKQRHQILKISFQSICEEKEELKIEAFNLQQTLQEVKQGSDSHQNETQVLIEKIKNLNESFEKLQIEHADLSICYQHLNHELQVAEKKCEQLETSNDNCYGPQNLLQAWQHSDREQRRFQGLYLQLQEQFEELSERLSLTRKQLFESEERNESAKISKHETELEHCFMEVKLYNEICNEWQRCQEECELLEKLVEFSFLEKRVF